ncbi:hypothetical protein MTP04_14990 [Lysinibacillus sp. PLM2]|nr:hypothetical protein MTP04_14990 [Lysinibacillus sp. PLM2]
MDTVTNYINNLFGADDVVVRRYNGNYNLDLENIGGLATAIYDNIESYTFNDQLSNFTETYCSKFVWQAYYLASGIDPLGKGYDYYDEVTFILPDEFMKSGNFRTIKTYNR